MDDGERRAILEEIARDESNYPRDRIAAIGALRSVDQEGAQSLENELDSLIRHK